VFAAVRQRIVFGAERLVLYDGGCGTCSRAAIILSRLDGLGRLRYADVSSDWSVLSSMYSWLDRDACLADMHVIVNPGDDPRWGRASVVAGFDAYRSLAWVVPLGWIALPFAYLPGARSIGRRAYRLFAPHRTTTSCPVPSAVK
jgi:predicted DCC family thiol-disulfide oxidoreductase YuxK